MPLPPLPDPPPPAPAPQPEPPQPRPTEPEISRVRGVIDREVRAQRADDRAVERWLTTHVHVAGLARASA